MDGILAAVLIISVSGSTRSGREWPQRLRLRRQSASVVTMPRPAMIEGSGTATATLSAKIRAVPVLLIEMISCCPIMAPVAGEVDSAAEVESQLTESQLTVGEIMTPAVFAVDEELPVSHVANRLQLSPRKEVVVNSTLSLCAAALVLVAAAPAGLAQRGTPRTPASTSKPAQAKPAAAPSRAQVLAIAAEYVKTVTPTLSLEQKQAVDKIKFRDELGIVEVPGRDAQRDARLEFRRT